MLKTLRGRRWTGWSKRQPSLLRPFPVLRVEELEARTTPATFTWTGLGTNPNWSNGGNWAGGVAPTGVAANADSLSFPAGTTVRATNNDILNGTFFSISISDSDYTLAGKAITLGSPSTTGNIDVATGITRSKIDLNIQLGAGAGTKQFFTVGDTSDFTINGKLSGTSGAIFTKDGNGILVLTGDNSQFTGDVYVNDNAGPLEITNPLALGDSTGRTIVGFGGTLQVNNVVGNINEPLTLNGAGRANLGAVTSVGGNANTWTGTVLVDTDSTFGAKNGTTLTFTNTISDGASARNIKKEDEGNVVFAGSNSYRGSTTIEDGTLTVANRNALGLGNRLESAGTIVNQTLGKEGRLAIGSSLGSNFTILNEFIRLNGQGIGANLGSMFNAVGDNNWAGPVTLGGPVSSAAFVSIGVAANTNLIISGVVRDHTSPIAPFPLIKVQPGQLILNNANTYAGTTSVTQGILDVRDSGALGANTVSVSDGATLRLDVEAGLPTAQFGYDQATGNEFGRNLWNDSVLGAEPHRLQIANGVTIAGFGVGGLGALHSNTGINRYTGTISLIPSQAAIGVATDPRPGHPTPTAAYFTDDYSLTPNVIANAQPTASTLVKRDTGHLILGSTNTYTGQTLIESGWITARVNGALSNSISTIVSNNAALHLHPSGGAMTIVQDLTIAGNGISHPYTFINGKGALMSLNGNNSWGLNIISGDGDITLAGTAGIGVEAVFPLGNSPNASSLTISSSISQSVAGSGLNKWGSQRLTLLGDGTYSGAVNVNEGVLRVGRDDALGWATSGTFNSQQIITQTDTVVARGSVLELREGTADNNGGLVSGIRVPDERLVLSGQGQQVAVAGDTTNPFALYSLTYTSPVAGSFVTSPLHITATAQQVQDALNWLDPITQTMPSLVQTDGQFAIVTQVGNVYQVRFGSALSAPVPALSATPVPPPPGFTAAEVRITNGTNSLLNVSNDNSWRGPVTLLSSSRIDTNANTRLSLLGVIDDSPSTNGPGSHLVKRGSGDLLLAGTNSYRGQTLIAQGVVSALNGLAFGFGDTTAGSGTTVSANAQLQISGGLTFPSERLEVQGTGTTGASTLVDQWFNVGPSPTNQGQAPSNQPTSARITSAAVDPTDSNVIYIATAGGGAWKTKNGGLTWLPLFDNTVDPAAVMYGSQIVVAYDGTVYFATGEPNGTANGTPVPGPNDNYVGSGVYVSTNRGRTWTLLTGTDNQNPIFGQSVTKLIVDPEHSGRIYVATSTLNARNTYTTAPTPIAGVYRYSNGTWVNLTGNPSPRRLGELGQAPYDAAVDSNTGFQNPGAPGSAGPDDDYRIRFPQGGAMAWSDIFLVKEGDLTTTTGFNRGNHEATANPLGNRNAYVLYAALSSPVQNFFIWDGVTGGAPPVQAVLNGVYRTENPLSNNPTWWMGEGTIFAPEDPNNLGNSLPPTPPDERPENGFNAGPVVNPGTGVVAGVMEWIKLTGDVISYFGRTTNPSINVYAAGLNSINGRKGELFAMQQSSTTGGITGSWIAIPIPSTPVFGLNTPTTFATGLYDANLTQMDTSPGLVGNGAVADVLLGGKDSLFRMAAGSLGNWTDLSATATNAPAGNFHGTTTRTANSFLAFSDGGIWSYNGTAFTNLNGTLSITQLNSADAHPTDITQAYGASYNNGIQRYSGSLVWNRVNTALGNGTSDGDNAAVVRFDPKNPNIAYSVQNGRVYKTTDNGQTWNLINIASTNSNTLPLVVDPLNTNRLLIGGTGLYESTNAGGSFTNLNAPFTPTSIAAAQYQGDYVADGSFPNITPGLSNFYTPDTIYIANDTSIAVTKNRGLSWDATRAPTLIDSRYRINFDGYLRYKQVPLVTVTTSSPEVYATVKTTVDGFTALNGYPTDSLDGGLGEMQSIEVVTMDVTGTFQITFTYQDANFGPINFTTVPIAVDATTQEVEDAINLALGTQMTGPEIQRIEISIPPGASPTMKLIFNGVESSDITLTGGNDTAAIQAAVDEIFAPFTISRIPFTNNYLATSTSNNFVDLMYATASDATVRVYEIQEGGDATATVFGFGDEVQQVQVEYALPTNNPVMTLRFMGQNIGPFTLPTDAATVQAAINAHPFIQANGVVTVTMTSVFLPGAPQPDTSRRDTFTITFNGGALANRDQQQITIPNLLQNNLTLNIATTITDGGRREGSGITFTNIVVNQANRDEIFATGRYVNSQNGPVLFRSIDAGITWEDITGNLPTVQTWTAAFDPRSETLYIGGDKGVWRLQNAVDTGTFAWTQFGNGLENVQVHDLVLNQSLNTLTAATYGRGMVQLFLTDYRANSGAIRAVSGTSIWNGPVVLTGDTRIEADGTQNIRNGIAAASLNIVGTISSPTGDFNILKEGQGTLILSGANTYGGVTDVARGVLQVNNPNALGDFDPASNTIVRSGAALELATDLYLEPVTVFGDGFSFNNHNTGAIRNIVGNNTYTGLLTMATPTTIGTNSGTTLTIGAEEGTLAFGNGSITDNGNNFRLTKELTGTLVLGNANTYGGITEVLQGALRVSHADALGSAAAGTFVTVGAQLQISRNNVTRDSTIVQSEPLFLSGTGIFGTGAMLNVRGDSLDDSGGKNNDNTWRGPIEFRQINAAFPTVIAPTTVSLGSSDIRDTLTLDVGITQQSAGYVVNKVGAGRVTFRQNNFYSGQTNVLEGYLRIMTNGGLGTGAPGTVVTAGATLELDGTLGTLNPTEVLTINGDGVNGVGALNNVVDFDAAGNSYTGPITIGSDASIGAEPFTRLTIVGALQDPVQGAVPVVNPVPGRLRKAGQGTVVLPNAKAYAGTTVVSDGILNILAADALGTVRNEVQFITVNGTAGSFALSFKGQSTGAIRFDATAAEVETALEGLTTIAGSSVAVTLNISGGTRTYRIEFDSGPLQNTDQPDIVAIFIAPTIATATNGTATLPEVQTVRVLASNGAFGLTFNGARTAAIPVNASALEVQNALNAISSIGGAGGSVVVNRTGLLNDYTYTVTFAGALGTGNLPQMTSTVISGTQVVQFRNRDGQRGTIVESGATLQLEGGMNFTFPNTGELITLNGQGFNGMGALNVLNGSVNFDVPLLLGSNSSISVTNPGDTLSINSLISDAGGGYGLDIYGLGLVQYNGNGTGSYSGTQYTGYTGTTTVHSGELRLNVTGLPAILGPLVVGDGVAPIATVKALQNHQVADAQPVTVRADGIFDLNGKTDTFGNLVMTGGDVFTRDGGQLTTGTIDMTAGAEIHVGNNATLAGNATTMTDSDIHVGTNSSVNVNGNLSMNNSGIDYLSPGPGFLTITGNLSMVNGSTIGFTGATGSLFINAQDIFLDASFIDLNSSSEIAARNITVQNASHIRIDDLGKITATGAVNVLSGSDITLDENGRFDITGKLTLNNGVVSLGNATPPNLVAPTKSTLTAAEIDMTGGTSLVNIGDYGYLTTTGKVTDSAGKIQFGINGTFTAGGDVSLSNLAKVNFGDNGTFSNQPFDLILSASEFKMGNNGFAKTRNVSLSNDSLVQFGNDGELLSSGNLTMTGLSDLVFATSGKATTGVVQITGGTISFTDDGELYTGNVTNTGAAISFGNTSKFQSTGNVVVNSGGSIGFGSAPTPTFTVAGGINGVFSAAGFLNMDNGAFWMGAGGQASANGVSLANGSKMTFDANGKLTDTATLNMTGASEIRFRNGGQATATNLTQNGGIIQFVDNGSLDVDTVSLTNGTIQFQDFGNFTPDGVTANNSTISFRDNGTFNAAGNVSLTKSNLTFRDNANADMFDLSTSGTTTVTLRDNGTIDTKAVTVTSGTTLTFGNNDKFTAAGNVSISGGSGTFGTDGLFDITGDFTLNANVTTFKFGNNGKVLVHGTGNVNLTSGKLEFADGGTLDADGDLTMTGASSRLIFAKNGTVEVDDLSITLGAITMGDGAKMHGTGGATISGAPVTLGLNSTFDFDGDVTVSVNGASPASIVVGAGSTFETAKLTVTTATVNIGAGSTANTGDIALTGTSKMLVGANTVFNSGNITSTAGTWTFGNTTELNSSGSASFTNATVTFGTGSKLTAEDDLSLNNTNMTFGNTGLVSVEDVFITNKAKLTFGSPGSLTANGPLNDQKGTINLDNGQLRFNTGGSLTGGYTTLIDSSIQGGNNITVSLGNLNMDPSVFTFGDGSNGTFTGDVDIQDGNFGFGSNADVIVTGKFTSNNAGITFGSSSSLSVTGDVEITRGSVTAGDFFDYSSANATFVNMGYTQGDFGTFVAGNLSLTDALARFGQGNAGSILDLGMVNSTLILGAGTSFGISGNITAESTASGVSSIQGDGAIDLGSTDHSASVGNGDAANTVDFAIFTEIVGTGRLTKSGAGRLELADPTGAIIDVSILAGDVQVSTSAGNVELTGATASLSGVGTVGSLTGTGGGAAIGLVAPGNNWDTLASGVLSAQNAVWGPQTTFNVDLSSSTPGSPQPGLDYDQLSVAGNIDLGNAVLTANFGSGILLNDTFTIIASTGGTVSGKFQQFNGQDILFTSGQKFNILYTPTSVVLQKVRANATVSITSNTPNPSTLNQNVTIVATVVPELGSSLFSGTMSVTLYDNGNALASPVVNLVGPDFIAVYTTSSLTVGSHTLTATFNGDANNFNPSDSLAPHPVQTVQQPYAAALTAAPNFISPNNPSSVGVQDGYLISTTVFDERSSINWTIDIRNSSNTIVRTLSGTGNPGAGTTIPISTTWDGRNTASAFVPDGLYTATLTVVDGFGNTFGVAPTSVTVDNTSPTATLGTPSQIAIDPTASSVLPSSTTFTGTVGDTNLTGWVLSIRNGAALLRSYSGTGTSVNVSWNGLYDPLDATDPVNPTVQAPDAAYTVTLTSTDAAGNTTSSSTQTVVVLANGPIVTVTSNSPSVYGNTFTLTAAVTLPAGSPSSLINLLNGDTVQFFRGATLVGSGTLAFNSGTNQYEVSVPHPILNAGTYTNFRAVYVASTDFPQGTSPNASHTINPAPLTITAQNRTRTYGAANPSFPFTTSGLVNGDTTAVLSGTLATTANATSNVGTYPITQGTLAPNNGNYVITTFNNGTLNVTPAFLTLDIDDKSRPVNTPNPAFTFTVLGLLNGDPASLVTSLPMSTTAVISSPVGSYPITASGAPVLSSSNYTVGSIVPGALAITPVLTNFAAGSGTSVSPTDPSRLVVYSPSGAPLRSFTPFGSFSGGIRTAVADFNGDGVLDIAAATGPGAVSQVTIFNGVNNAPLYNVLPFEEFTGGLFVAAGDIDADGIAELVITPDEGGGPRVLVIKGGSFTPFLSYFGINDPNFRGGARAGVGDMNGDGYAEIAVSAGFQGGPRISIWDGKMLAASQFRNTTPDFFAFDQSLRNGAFVAIGDVNGDGFGDLIAGAGPGGAPHVKIFSGVDMINPLIGPSNTAPFASFFAGDSNNRGGVRVTAKVLDNDLFVDLVTGAGDAGGDQITAYLGSDLKNGASDIEFALDFPGLNNNGVFVG